MTTDPGSRIRRSMAMADARTVPATVHQAVATMRTAGGGQLDLRVCVTSGGLLAIGALVSSILLSSAVIVAVAKGRGPRE